MEIRLIETSDAENFVKFYDKLIRETQYLLPTVEESAKTVEQQENSIKKYGKNKHVFVAIENGQIVGFMGISRTPISKVKHIASFAIGVLDEHQRKGIASKLMKSTEKWLKDTGVSRVEMTVISENKPAISCYERNGYKREGTREKSISMNNKYYDEIYMAKII